MNSELFLKTHRDDWGKLSAILEQISSKGPASLSSTELTLLGKLFRRVTAHLAYARTNYPDHEIIDYLNNLVVKAHGHIYKRETLGFHQLGDFLRYGFPKLIVKQWHFVVAAGLILILGLITGYLLHFIHPSLDEMIIPYNMKREIVDGLGHGQVGANWDSAERPAISAMIMANNIRVGVLAFALGFTWGLGTVIILFDNGLLVGTLGAIFTSQNYTLDFWSLILPHGVLELAAIFICGGAGLVLAKAVVKPGDYTRRDALIIQGTIALKLVMGTLPLFILAALIEGFITPSQLANYYKLGFAGGSMLVFILYIYMGNRSERKVRHITAGVVNCERI